MVRIKPCHGESGLALGFEVKGAEVVPKDAERVRRRLFWPTGFTGEFRLTATEWGLQSLNSSISGGGSWWEFLR